MKISTRLAIFFSTIVSCFLIAFGFTIYILSSKHEKREFQERLKERALIGEKIFREREYVLENGQQPPVKRFIKTLPDETEELLRIEEGKTPTFKHHYPSDVIEQLLQQEEVYFEDGKIQGVSRTFQIGSKKYVLIVTAIDHAGIVNLAFLQKTILLLVLIGIPLIFIGSFFVTRRALLPISRKIDRANSISATNLHQRLNVYNPHDELGKMAIAFNKLLDRLEASFEAQRAFIRNASHEIRNPLTAIMGEAEIAMSKSRTEAEYMESLNAIMSEAETLNTTVTNLLQLSKVAASEENIVYEPVYFDQLLHEVKESFDFQNPRNKVELAISTEQEQHNFSIQGNKNLLKTAILNVFDNACKFSSNDLVKVSLSRNNTHLTLEVSDQGIGILDNDMAKIMTPFFRGNNAMKIKGSGIGLPLCLKIISLHNGKLDVKSQIGKGTQVEIMLPLTE
jgi:signal transduction histidine kinase